MTSQSDLEFDRLKRESEDARVREWLVEKDIANKLRDELGAPSDQETQAGWSDKFAERILCLIQDLTPERLAELQEYLKDR